MIALAACRVLVLTLSSERQRSLEPMLAGAPQDIPIVELHVKLARGLDTLTRTTFPISDAL